MCYPLSPCAALSPGRLMCPPVGHTPFFGRADTFFARHTQGTRHAPTPSVTARRFASRPRFLLLATHSSEATEVRGYVIKSLPMTSLRETMSAS